MNETPPPAPPESDLPPESAVPAEPPEPNPSKGCLTPFLLVVLGVLLFLLVLCGAALSNPNGPR
jgi:hypothetical protein